MRMTRKLLYSMGASVLLAVALGAWTGKSEHASEFTEIKEKSTIATPSGGGVAATPERSYRNHVRDLYRELGLAATGLDSTVFDSALTGFYNLKAAGKLSGDKDVLSIVDFTKSSREKRLWILDLDRKEVAYNTWVAHGKNSGGDRATRFSNKESSHQSSLGFYLTGEVYYGKHGRSLRLDGMDPGFNSNARKRAIVLHGADYVSPGFIKRVGRLGRSFGCPAVPADLSDEIIDRIREKTVLYIHGPQTRYRSDYLNARSAATFLMPVNG